MLLTKTRTRYILDRTNYKFINFLNILFITRGIHWNRYKHNSKLGVIRTLLDRNQKVVAEAEDREVEEETIKAALKLCR